jgi:hypothetical protein
MTVETSRKEKQMARSGRNVGGYGLSSIFYVIAVILFVVAAFGYTLGQHTADLGLLGLAFFAAANVV